MSEPTKATSKWADLMPRVASAFVLVLLGLLALYFGPKSFTLLVLLFLLLGFWELWNMARMKGRAGGLEGGDVTLLLSYALFAAFGCLGLIILPFLNGMTVVVYLIILVACTDTAGYVAGRFLGGPLFWPRISPKKTWSGVLAGWLSAAVVAILFAPLFDGFAVGTLIVISVLLSRVSQAGDFLESGLKRRMGVKDSSNIIRGHGGVLDRFDGLIAVGGLAYVLLSVG